MIKVRASQITIETPKEGAEPWIRVVVQRIEKNGEIVNTVDRWDSFNKRLSDVAMQSFNYPISIYNNFTVMDTASLLTFVVLNWLAEKYNGTINADGDVILEP